MTEQPALKHLFHTGPVTALHVYNEKWIIAGIGSYLYVYDIDKHLWQQKTHVLPCRCIHGIRQERNQDHFCIFGEKCCRVICVKNISLENKNQEPIKEGTISKEDHSVELDLSEDKDPIQNVRKQDICSFITCESNMVEMEDWIWDSNFLNKTANRDVVLALGHNVIVRWDWIENTIKQRICCVENCILYCAKFIGHNWDNLILAAGTVFNQVLLWSPNGQKSEENRMEIIHKLTGHQGVIFSVDYNIKKKIICSVSDDRSIIVWQLKFPSSDYAASDSDTCEISLSDWIQCESIKQCVLYGHSARVWDVKIMTTGLVSVGEDSTCCVWNDQGKVLQKFKGHKGKSIWSMAVNSKEDFVVTGGGDTSIRLWKLGQGDGDEHNSMTQLTLSLPITQMDSEDKDFPRSTCMISYHHVIIMTNEGNLYLHDLNTKRWTTLMKDKTFRSYTVVALSPYSNCVVALGNIAGKLKVLVCCQTDLMATSEWIQHEWQLYSGNIFSLQWLSNDFILTTGPDGNIDKWKFTIEGRSLTLKPCRRYFLPKCKQRWVSAAGLLAPHGLLICGDRGGTIHVYDDVPNFDSSAEMTLEPKQSFIQIHGKSGVTDICCHGDDVYSGGRDGFYRKFNVNDGFLTHLTSYKVYKGFEWIDRLKLVTDDGDILIYGFQSTDFVLWSVNNNQKLVQIPCGGGHRAWDCVIKEDEIRMTYLKTGEVIIAQTFLQRNQMLLKESLHGRELKCVKFLRQISRDGCIVVTGSEDTGIQLSVMDYNKAGVIEIKKIQSLQGHISSVRAFSSCSSYSAQPNTNRKLLFSAGGRAQILIWSLSFPETCDSFESMAKDVSCENVCTYMLGHSKKKGRTRSWKLQKIKPNPETRFMDLCSVPVSKVWKDAPKHLYILGTACSDAYVRFYVFDEEKETLTLLKESLYHKHCVLKITYLYWQNRTVSNLIYLTTATDGSIAFWDITDLILNYLQNNSDDESETSDCDLNDDCVSQAVRSTVNDSALVKGERDQDSILHTELPSPSHEKDICDKFLPVTSVNHHQSGVNSLHVQNIDEETFLLATGGDDNAIVISLISKTLINKKNVSIQQKVTGVRADAHAAQITGVHLLSTSQLLSVAIDQRLCLWDFRITDTCIEIKQIYCQYVNVSDIASMEVWCRKRDQYGVLLAGQGLSLWKLIGVK